MNKNIILNFMIVILLLSFNINVSSQNNTSEDDRLKNRTLGFEFWTNIKTQKSFTYEAVKFPGEGEGFKEMQREDIKIDPDPSSYDVGIFYRYKKIKVGWIVTATSKTKYHKNDFIKYRFNYEGRERNIGGYDLDITRFNLGYFEFYGLRSQNMNTYISALLRFDHVNIKGNINTYKYPFGDEWYVPEHELIVHHEKLNEKIFSLSIGPKIAYDLSDITKSIPEGSIFRHFKGLELSFLIDAYLGSPDKFDIKGNQTLISFLLEF